MADPSVPIAEDGRLSPVSLYAEQKVAIERLILADARDGLARICLRLATVYGAAPRMRFDLTVNEFTRDLWAGRLLEVFGEQFWRPYIHVRDVATAVELALNADVDDVAGEVFNVGSSAENYRKLDLVELISRYIPDGRVTCVRRDEDPRDYKVNFEKVRTGLGFDTTMTVNDGIREIIDALSAEQFGDPFSDSYRNTPSVSPQ
jgi:nucleoside-diphosphate-sugar epimerase